MDIIAVSNNVKISPRKVRHVVDSVKKYTPTIALGQLYLLNKRAAVPLKKAIESAMANAVHNFKVNKDELVIKDIMVNEGVSYKRFHFAARGRTRPYKKRISHIKVILTVGEIRKGKGEAIPAVNVENNITVKKEEKK